MGWGTAVVAVVTALGGLLSYQAGNKAPDPPPVPETKPPPNKVVKDHKGRIIYQEIYDPDTHTYNTQTFTYDDDEDGKEGAAPSPMDEYYQQALEDLAWEREQYRKEREWIAEENKVRSELRMKFLENMNAPPEDRIKAYEEYAEAYSGFMHEELDPLADRARETADEKMNARGMFGSRAWVDTHSEIEENKLKQDTEIANRAAMVREDLAERDRNYWLNAIMQLDNIPGEYSPTGAANLAMQGKAIDAQIASQMSADSLAWANFKNSKNFNWANMGVSGANTAWGQSLQAQAMNNQDAWNRYYADITRRAGMADRITSTVSGLAYLYGLYRGGRSPLSQSSGTPWSGGAGARGYANYSLNMAPRYRANASLY